VVLAPWTPELPLFWLPFPFAPLFCASAKPPQISSAHSN
jgi:hypothetical protein